MSPPVLPPGWERVGWWRRRSAIIMGDILAVLAGNLMAMGHTWAGIVILLALPWVRDLVSRFLGWRIW